MISNHAASIFTSIDAIYHLTMANSAKEEHTFSLQTYVHIRKKTHK